MAPLISLFFALINVYHGFSSQGGFPCLSALLAVCNGLVRFTSGVTPADFLVASMVEEPFLSTYLCTNIGEAGI